MHVKLCHVASEKQEERLIYILIVQFANCLLYSPNVFSLHVTYVGVQLPKSQHLNVASEIYMVRILI